MDFIPSTPMPLFHQLWKYVVPEAAEVRIHDVERHLAGIKMEVILCRRL